MPLVSSFPSRAILGFAVLISGWVCAAGRAQDARVYVQFVPGQKAAGRAAVAQVRAKEHHVFEELDAVAVTIPEVAREALARNPAILLIEDDPTRGFLSTTQPPQTVPYGIAMVQAPEAVLAGATGAGIKVGVIDSGVFVGHADLAGVTLTGFPKYGTNDERNWDRDQNSHGTHVVGTITAANNAVGVVGVSPGKVAIHMVKVFGDAGNWIYSSDLLAAANQAASTGAKIISMSLGGPRSSGTESRGLSDLYKKGILLVAAAGNEGTSATSYPAGYASVISVGAVDQSGVRASFSQYNSTVELAAPGVGVTSTVSYLETNTVTVGTTTVSGHHIEFAGRTPVLSGPIVHGLEAISTNPDWSGKIVLVDRGTNSFAEKVRNVQASGGIACIIANNTGGELFATLGSASSDASIPAIGITQADGSALKTLITGAPTASVTSVVAQNESAYEAFDGTSMATPHVSGVAALLWSAFPQLTNVQLRDVLVKTAKDLGVPGRDNEYGYGLVQALDAIKYLGGVTTPPQEPPPGSTDTTAPLISNFNPRVTSLKTGSFEFTWTTNEAATSDVFFEGLGDYPDPDPALVTAHKRTFRGTRGATYRYSVTSADAAGNRSVATTGTFTVQ